MTNGMHPHIPSPCNIDNSSFKETKGVNKQCKKNVTSFSIWKIATYLTFAAGILCSGRYASRNILRNNETTLTSRTVDTTGLNPKSIKQENRATNNAGFLDQSDATFIEESIDKIPDHLTTRSDKEPQWYRDITSENKATKARPFAEYEKTGFLIFSDDNSKPYYDKASTDIREIKQTLAKELPEDVQLIVYTDSYFTANIRNEYNSVIGKDRLHIVHTPSGSDLWTRDTAPIAIYDEDGNLALVDALHHSKFEPDYEISKFFKLPLHAHGHFFEGGNFIADSNGNCVTVDNPSKKKNIPDDVFQTHYKCRNTTRLKYITGIGHVDEVVKFINSENVITDQPIYKDIFEAKGYKVTMLPQAQEEYETYINSVIIDKIAVVPIFNLDTDNQAIEAYQSFGLKVFPINSTMLSNYRKGSVHCITMTYPPISKI